MGLLSPAHWILAALVVLLVFGPKTLAKIGRQAGRTVRAVTSAKKALTDAPAELVREVTSGAPTGRKKT